MPQTVLDHPGIGLHAGIPMDLYHRMPGASSGALRTMAAKSPAHVQAEREQPSEPTAAQRIGSAVHTAVLEPDLWADGYVRAPEGDGRTKAVRDARAELEDAHPDATILHPDEYDLCVRVRDAVAAHPRAKALLEGQPERSAWWEDPETGVLCRGRFDLISAKAPALVDLKTTRDASPESFAKDALNMRYDLQAVHYWTGGQAVGLDVRYFAFVAVEKTPPYAVAIYRFPDEWLSLVAEEHRRLLLRWKRCEESGEWPSYDERTTVLDVPEWRYRRAGE